MNSVPEKAFSLYDETNDATKLQIRNFLVFQNILQKLPISMPSFDRISIIRKVQKYLGTMDLNVAQIPWHTVVLEESIINMVVKNLSEESDMSFENFLCPPVKRCFQDSCKQRTSELSINHKPTQVVICTESGLETGSVFNYRCRYCGTSYNYDMYKQGDVSFFYKEERPFVKGSQVLYVSRNNLRFWRQLSLHSQVSYILLLSNVYIS